MVHKAQRLDATFATATTLSTAGIYIGDAQQVAIELATFGSGLSTTSTIVYMQVAQSSTGTYRRMSRIVVSGATSFIEDWTVPTFEGNRAVVVPDAKAFNYCKVELANATTHTFGCWVHVRRYD